MDYTKTSLAFRIRKVIRYIKMYGLQRTFVKIQAQRHLHCEKEFTGERWINPKSRINSGEVAIIGCGNFAYNVIAYYVSKHKPYSIKYTYDIKKSRALSLCKRFHAYSATTCLDDILDDPAVKLIYIASNHASHTEYAIKAIERGKSVHIEKPHAVSIEQLNRLIVAAKNYPEVKLFLGFNRPKSSLFQKLKLELDKQSGAMMMNWFIVGHQIEETHWYYSKEEGGRVLGNLCHWTDLCLHLLGCDKAFPCVIQCAQIADSRSDFAVIITFADQSVAGLTFSTKGYAFEGIREYLNVHKGDLLASLNDFYDLKMDIVNKKYSELLRYRDHGHQANILDSYINALDENGRGEKISYIYQTALLILKIKEAIETGKSVICTDEEQNELDYSSVINI